MSSIDLFSEPRRQLRRAKHHVGSLKRAINHFGKKELYTRTTEIDADGITKLHKLKLARPLPDSWEIIASEALDAFKSALDQTGYAAAVAGKAPRLRYTAFPIGSDLANWTTALGYSKDIPSEITNLFARFEPYQGGDGAVIWAANVLRNTRHTILAPIVTAMAGVKMKGRFWFNVAEEASDRILFHPPSWDSNKNEIIIGRDGPTGVNFQQDGKFGLRVSFNNSKIGSFNDMAAVDLLDALALRVTNIIKQTEAECRRLGWIT